MRFIIATLSTLAIIWVATYLVLRPARHTKRRSSDPKAAATSEQQRHGSPQGDAPPGAER